MKKQARSGWEKAELVAGYEASGLTRRAYCEERGISLTTLGYYRRRRQTAGGLVAVEVAGSAAGSTMAVVLGNGRRIEVSGDFGEAELARLLRTVERA